MPATNNYSITVPGTTESLSILRAFVMGTARRAGLSEVEAGKLEIAVCEACANIVEHAYGVGGARAAKIVVRLSLHANRIVITIVDESKESHPVNQMEIVTLEEFIKSNRKRGLGTYIIRKFVDKVEHTFSPRRGNTLRLTKYK